jgi:hypothetical protein
LFRFEAKQRFLHAKRNGHKAKNSETKQIKEKNSVLDKRISNFRCRGCVPGSYSSLKGQYSKLFATDFSGMGIGGRLTS